MKRELFFLLYLLFLMASFNVSPQAQETNFKPEFPLGLDPDYMQVPEDNPITPEKVTLGQMLYFDKRLSKDGTISCATCHHPKKGWSDQRAFSEGIGGQFGDRNSPTVLNSGFSFFQFWDGRAPTLEEQAKGPIENPVEMGHALVDAEQRIAAVKGYAPYFQAAFGDEEVTIDRIAKAIATFERTVLSGNSAWDRYTQLKDEAALSDSAKRGLELFEGKALCTRCHVGFTLSDSLFHNIGVGMDEENPDLGRYKVTGKEEDKGAFKTPMLRDLLKTAPYMHDGSVETLEEVIEFYDRGGEANPWLDPKMEPLNLTEQEKKDLVAFLESLEGDWEPMDEPELPEDD